MATNNTAKSYKAVQFESRANNQLVDFVFAKNVQLTTDENGKTVIPDDAYVIVKLEQMASKKSDKFQDLHVTNNFVNDEKIRRCFLKMTYAQFQKTFPNGILKQEFPILGLIRYRYSFTSPFATATFLQHNGQNVLMMNPETDELQPVYRVAEFFSANSKQFRDLNYTEIGNYDENGVFNVLKHYSANHSQNLVTNEL